MAQPQSKEQAADAFNALSKQQQLAKLEEVRVCLKSGTYVLKANESKKKSEAYDLFQIITDKAGGQSYSLLLLLYRV